MEKRARWKSLVPHDMSLNISWWIWEEFAMGKGDSLADMLFNSLEIQNYFLPLFTLTSKNKLTTLWTIIHVLGNFAWSIRNRTENEDKWCGKWVSKNVNNAVGWYHRKKWIRFLKFWIEKEKERREVKPPWQSPPKKQKEQNALERMNASGKVINHVFVLKYTR